MIFTSSLSNFTMIDQIRVIGDKNHIILMSF